MLSLQEALNILTEASGMAPLNRATHQKIIEAVEVLQKEITPKEKTK